MVCYNLLMLTLLVVIMSITDTLHYPYHTGVLQFPHDEGAHFADTVTSEWWYVNMNLVDETGDSFGIMLTHFRRPAVARIFNLTDISQNTFYSSVSIFGSLFTDTGHVYITYRNLYGTVEDTNRWMYPEDGKPFSYLIKVDDREIGVSCSLNLEAFEYPFAIDSLGIVTLGDSGNISYYYAIPFINVQGELNMGNERHSVHGIAWIDRQWGPFGVSPQGGYEWFSVVSSEGDRWLGLQVWNLFEGDSVPHNPNYRHLNIFAHTSDTSFQIYTSRFILERLGYLYDSATQKYFSKGWRILWQRDSDFFFVEIHPEVENQITTFVTSRFYEGVTWISKISANFGGEEFIRHSLSGYGYAELVQKYDDNIVPPSAPRFVGFNYDPSAAMVRITWHPSIMGTYPVAGYRIYFLDPQDPDVIKYFQVSQDTFVEIPSPSDNRLAIMISAFDSASAVNGSDLAGPFIFTNISESRSHLLPVRIRFTNKDQKLDVFANSSWNLDIVSADGRIIKRFGGTGESSVRLKLTPGVYFAILKSKGYKKVQRFTVIH